MHFALPPRKTSQPPPYARAAARSLQNRRRSQLQAGAIILCSLLSLWLLLHFCFFSRHTGKSASKEDFSDNDFNILLLTVLDDTMSNEHIQKIKINRDDYAVRHGYRTVYTNVSTYDELVNPAPKSWTLIPALRHALNSNPHASHIFSLTPHALITNSTLPLESHILSHDVLPGLMIRDVPVVPPDSVIRTFSHLTSSQTDLVLTQDLDNLAHTSMLLRNSAWSRYLLDVWFDPLYRAYNFQKAEQHALEHIVQWHPTLLAKLVLIPSRRMNSYSYSEPPEREKETDAVRFVDTMWQPGDLLVNFNGCDDYADRNCETEFDEYYEKWLAHVEENMNGVLPAQEVDP